MAFVVNVPCSIVSVVSQLFQGNQNGIWTGFRSLNFQAYDFFEEKDLICLRLFFKILFFAACNYCKH